MSLETAFGELAYAFDELRIAFVGLRLTTVEDQPEQGSVALVDWFADFVEDLRGAVEAGVEAVEEGRRAAQHPRDDLKRAHGSLLACQQARDLIRDRLSSQLSPGGQVKDLSDLGLSRGGEWQAWAIEVLDALKRCRQALDRVVDPLFTCWQEIAEALSSPLVSIHATNIGQILGGDERSASKGEPAPRSSAQHGRRARASTVTKRYGRGGADES
jgi:hypothetical protein